MAKRPNPTQAELRQLLNYNPSTGKLTWRPREGKWSSRWNKRYAGAEAGTLNDGYIVLKIYDRNFLAHRVIWAMIHDCWPECIDHKDGNRANNRLRNLRAVSRKINQRNQGMHRSNTSGITGVYWYAPTRKWLASIRADGQQMHLGFFEVKEDAALARREAERRLHFTGRK